MIDYEELSKIIAELKDRSNEAVILVEGRKDLLSLRRLGVQGKILTVSNLSRAKLVDEIGCSDVIILTDWDEKGEILKRDLIEKLSGIKVDLVLRKKLFSIVGRFIREIEDLADLYFKLQTHPRSL